MNARLELLSRKNKGKILLKEHLSTISSILGRKICEDDFLALEQSDEIRMIFFNKFRSLKKGDPGFLQLTFASHDFDQDVLFDNYLSDFKDTKCYWITNYSEYYGVLPINFFEIKGKILDIIEFDGDSMNLLTQDLKKGILLDYFEEQGETFYELSKWH